MNSSDSPSQPPDSSDAETDPEPVAETDEQDSEWVLTPAILDKLLARFSADRDEAGVQYELARRKVVRFFEWRCPECAARAEECADETLNRVARKIDEGQNINNLMAFILGVARNVRKENIKKLERSPISLEDAPPKSLQERAAEPIEPDARQICFDKCLDHLPAENRTLLLEYYQGDGAEKIKHRRKLAESMGIPLNALRIRVHRIRRTLESGIAECLKSRQERND